MSDWERIFGWPKLWELYKSILKRGNEILECKEVKDNVYKIETTKLIIVLNPSDYYDKGNE